MEMKDTEKVATELIVWISITVLRNITNSLVMAWILHTSTTNDFCTSQFQLKYTGSSAAYKIPIMPCITEYEHYIYIVVIPWSQ